MTCFPLQCGSDLGPEEGSGPERVQGAGDGAVVSARHGEAPPLPGALHPLPPGAARLPEGLL